MDSAMLAKLRVKFCVSQPGGCVLDPMAATMKSDADVAKTLPPQMLHITSASNSNPVVFTTLENINTSDWPPLKEQVSGGTGNGVQTTFSSTFAPTAATFPGSVTAFKGAVASATDDGSGGWATGATAGSIDYVTGAVTVTFTTPPTNGTPVNFVGYITKSQSLYLGGMAGATCTSSNSWTCLNNTGRVSDTATQTGLHTFTMPKDSTSWGAYPGGAVVFAINNDLPTTLFYGFESLQWLTYFEELAVMYQVTGDSSYVINVLTELDYINDLTAAGVLAPAIVDSSFAMRGLPAAMAMVYDWCYPLLSTAQKTATRASLKTWYDYYQANKGNSNLVFPGYSGCNPAVDACSIAHSNYYGGYVFGLGLAALAIGDDDSNGNTMIAAIRAELTLAMNYEVQDPQPGWYLNGSTECKQQGKSGPCGGNWAGGDPGIESFTYTPNHMNRILQVMYGVQTATGEDMTTTESWATKFLPAAAENFFHTMFPNLWQAPNIGESQVVTPLTLNTPAMIAWMRRGTIEGGQMSYMIAHATTPPGSLSNWQGLAGATTGFNIDGVLWSDSSQTQVDYTTGPTYRYSHGDGLVDWRTDWSTSGLKTVFVATAQNSGGHHARNAGSLTVTRGADYGIIHAGFYQGLNGYSGSGVCNCVDAIWYNTMNYVDGGAYMMPVGSYNTQALWGQWIDPKIKQSATYTYEQIDTTQAYDVAISTGRVPANRSVQASYRTHLQIGANSIVYDRVLGKSATYTGAPRPSNVRWFFSPITGAATLSGNTVSSVVGASKFWVTALLPLSTTITVTQPSPTNAYMMLINDAGTAAARTDYVSVIHADAAAGSNPTSTILTSSTNMFAAQVDDSTTPFVFVHSNVITPGSGNTYTPDQQTAATWTSSHSGTYTYFVGGLAPGTASVTLNGTPIVTGAAVGTDGTLTFVSTSGNFSLSDSPATSSTAGIRGTAKIGGKGGIH